MKCPRGCGREVVWYETLTGQKIPLDPRGSVYQVHCGGSDPGKRIVTPARDGRYLVNHFTVCNVQTNAKKGDLWWNPEAQMKR